VFRRDLRSWFGNPTGYLFILLFVALSAAALVFPREFFANNLANLDTLNAWFPWIAPPFVAAITMGMWTSERATGTQELLFTLPAKDSDLLLGKYLAGLGVYTMSLLFMLTLPIGLSFLGTPDWGQVLATFLGYWLFGALLISAAMIGSQLTDNLTVSFILGLLLAFLPARSDYLIGIFAPRTGAAWLQNGPSGQFAEFARGMVTTSGLALFVGLTVAFLYLNLALISRRNWRRGSDTGLHRSLRFVAIGVGSVALTVIAVYKLPRVDATVEQIHSLSGETSKLLANLDKNKPVIATAYISDDVPQSLQEQKRTLLNLLDRYEGFGAGAIQKRVVITRPYSEEARTAQKNYNIQPRGSRDAEGFEDGVFLGFVVQSGIEEVVVPFLEPGMSVEYELTRAIRVAANANRRKVGVLKTDVELYGGFDFQTYQQKQRWQIVDELQLQYKVENVDPDSEYPKDLDAMVVPQVSSLTQEQMDKLRTWILHGNPALLLEDPAPYNAPGTAATDQKGGRSNPMMGNQGGPQKGDLAGFLGEFSLQMTPTDLVWDVSYRTFPLLQMNAYEFLFVDSSSMSATDIVTKGLDRIVLLWSGYFRSTSKPNYTVSTLLRSQSPTPQQPNGTISKLEAFQFNPFNPNQMAPNFNAPLTIHPSDYPLAVRVEGPPAPAPTPTGDEKDKDGKPVAPPPAAGKNVRLIAIADLDAFSNDFFQMRRQAQQANLQFDNPTFVLNCIDSLVGDDRLIELRKRKPKLRQLTNVLAAEQRYEQEWIGKLDAAETAAKTKKDEAQKRLDDAVAKIKNNADLDESAKDIQMDTARKREQVRLDIDNAKIEDEKREQIGIARQSRETQKRLVQNWYQIWTVLLTPMPALAMGIMMFVRRRAREVQNVPKNRMVSGGAA
jgi:ABC-2 type transport system permease protein